MLRILTVFIIISLAVIGIVAGDCNQKLFDRAMQTGRNSFEQCDDATISTLTFAGQEPGRYGDPRNGSYRQFSISGDLNSYTARWVFNGSKPGPIYATVARKARAEGGDLITLVIGGMTYKAVLQPAAISEDSGIYVLQTICRHAVADDISDWPTFLNGSIKLALNSHESMPSKAQHFTLTPL